MAPSAPDDDDPGDPVASGAAPPRPPRPEASAHDDGQPDDVASGAAPPRPPPASSDTRAIDLVRRSAAGGAAAEAPLDAATIAQLAAWFGAPSAAAEPAAPDADDDEFRQQREIRERALAAVEPAFLGAILAHETRADTIGTLPEPPPLTPDPTIARFDLAVWHLPVTSEEREVEIPWALRKDLQECVPQAVLRDLHRPEEYFNIQYEMTESGIEAAFVDPRLASREVMATRYRQRLEDSTLAILAEERAALRAILEAPWEPPPKREALSWFEAQQWFGKQR
jgi:hypothetical protein